MSITEQEELEQKWMWEEVSAEINCDAIENIIIINVSTSDLLEDGCWNWQGKTNPQGRPIIGFGVSSELYAYRASFSFYFGRVPNGDCRHLCGNRLCVNPDHLSDGRLSDNDLDTRFHDYLKTIGLCAPFPLALRNWNVITATGRELFDIWNEYYENGGK